MLLPNDVLGEWGGGAEVAGDSDFARACRIEDEVGTCDVGHLRGLVLAGDVYDVAWWPTQSGGLLVRWVYADNHADAQRAVERAVTEAVVKPTAVSFETGASGACTLFSAVDEGFDPSSWVGASLRLSLSPSTRYSVASGDYKPDSDTFLVVHRLCEVARQRN